MRIELQNPNALQELIIDVVIVAERGAQINLTSFDALKAEIIQITLQTRMRQLGSATAEDEIYKTVQKSKCYQRDNAIHLKIDDENTATELQVSSLTSKYKISVENQNSLTEVPIHNKQENRKFTINTVQSEKVKN